MSLCFDKVTVTWLPAVSMHLCNSLSIWKVWGNLGQMSVSLLSNDSQLSETNVQTMTQPLCDFTGEYKPELTTAHCVEWLVEYWCWSCLPYIDDIQKYNPCCVMITLKHMEWRTNVSDFNVVKDSHIPKPLFWCCCLCIFPSFATIVAMQQSGDKLIIQSGAQTANCLLYGFDLLKCHSDWCQWG